MTALEEHLLGYLAVRRALGYKLARAEKLLAQFLRWLEDRGERTITTELASNGRRCRQRPIPTGTRSDSRSFAGSRRIYTRSTQLIRSRRTISDPNGRGGRCLTCIPTPRCWR